ncbi:hypothetical protein N9N00_00960 [Schleiferiaceae bacterium]|nr:hypothetical protein [Schleiferiaceae bacterium]
MTAVLVWTILFLSLAYLGRGLWPRPAAAKGCSSQCACTSHSTQHG